MELKTLEDIARDLGLGTTDTQDWGIINGAAHRLNEFTAYFERYANDIEDSARCELMDLLLSSVEGRMHGNDLNDSDLAMADQGLKALGRIGPCIDDTLTYWQQYFCRLQPQLESTVDVAAALERFNCTK